METKLSRQHKIENPREKNDGKGHKSNNERVEPSTPPQMGDGTKERLSEILLRSNRDNSVYSAKFIRTKAVRKSQNEENLICIAFL